MAKTKAAEKAADHEVTALEATAAEFAALTGSPGWRAFYSKIKEAAENHVAALLTAEKGSELLAHQHRYQAINDDVLGIMRSIPSQLNEAVKREGLLNQDLPKGHWDESAGILTLTERKKAEEKKA